MCNLTNGRIAVMWQNRAEEIHEATGKDCDETTKVIIDEMKADGLVIMKDFVTVYGTIGNQQHMCLELFGSNCKAKNGKPVFKFNGYRIDGTAYSAKLDNMWKGAYNE